MKSVDAKAEVSPSQSDMWGLLSSRCVPPASEDKHPSTPFICWTQFCINNQERRQSRAFDWCFQSNNLLSCEMRTRDFFVLFCFLCHAKYHHLPQVSLAICGAWCRLPKLRDYYAGIRCHNASLEMHCCWLYIWDVFFKSRSGIRNKEKSAGLAQCCRCVRSSLCGIVPTLTLMHIFSKKMHLRQNRLVRGVF